MSCTSMPITHYVVNIKATRTQYLRGMNNQATNKDQSVGASKRPEFWQVQIKTTQLAALTDIAFFFIFYVLDSPILAWFNIISVAMYVSAYYAIKRRNNKLAVILIFTEVLVHAAIGVVLIGWNSGFHYYLLIFIPALCLSSSRRNAIFALTLLFAYYVTLSMLSWSSNPIQPINAVALNFVHVFNLSVVFSLFSYLSFFYLGTVKKAQKKLHKMATTDPLTTLYNRRHLNVLADIEVERAKRYKNAFCVMLIDIDHFKTINDNHGHEVGDKVLVCVADILIAKMREKDIIARWGGEEFLIILPSLSSNEARISAERVQAELADYNWNAALGFDLQTTMSAGISHYKEKEDLNAAIARADHALYRSKANGRNRIEIEELDAENKARA
ncbi:GGDEF domain-containing protein [Glaciecola petra]|uniref:diguanylate cyclase n=1 Tax=Glaciecola petra TaxID=3075602 RepID=A0ABU2ZVB4_9ALTE|nr:diguanylate cyclase [Aestuariibacter sp. P117]MDT0596316.1 diguanylate cyclase [Aestuariibacter sp. P117]